MNNGLLALLELIQATYKSKTVEWFPGDDEDPPGWRAYMIHPRGYLTCTGAPPRLTREMAETDLQFCYFDNYSLPVFEPPKGWPGMQYGLHIENCGPYSFFGADIPKEKANDFCNQVVTTLTFKGYRL